MASITTERGSVNAKALFGSVSLMVENKDRAVLLVK